MRVLKKEVTIDEHTYQPKLQVLLEFDMEYAFDGNIKEYEKDMGYELVKLITETETTYPDYYNDAIYNETIRLENE